MRPVSAFEDTTGALQVSVCGNVGLVFRSGRPRGPGKPFQKVRGEAPHLFKGVSRAPGSARAPKADDLGLFVAGGPLLGGRGHGARSSEGSEIVDFGGLGGPGGPGNLVKRANLPNWPQHGPAAAEGWCFSNLIFRPAVSLCGFEVLKCTVGLVLGVVKLNVS